MKVRGNDGVQMRVAFREPAADPRWKRNYLRLMAVAFLGFMMWGAWEHSWQVILGSLAGSFWCAVMSQNR